MGNVTVIAWQIEEKREQRAPVARLQRGDTVNGRVSEPEVGTEVRRTSSLEGRCMKPRLTNNILFFLCVFVSDGSAC